MKLKTKKAVGVHDITHYYVMAKIILFAKFKTCRSCEVGLSSTGASRKDGDETFALYLLIKKFSSQGSNKSEAKPHAIRIYLIFAEFKILFNRMRMLFFFSRSVFLWLWFSFSLSLRF